MSKHENPRKTTQKETVFVRCPISAHNKYDVCINCDHGHRHKKIKACSEDIDVCPACVPYQLKSTWWKFIGGEFVRQEGKGDSKVGGVTTVRLNTELRVLEQVIN